MKWNYYILYMYLQPPKPETEADKINDEVKRQVHKCTCMRQYKIHKIGEGKYRVNISSPSRIHHNTFIHCLGLLTNLCQNVSEEYLERITILCHIENSSRQVYAGLQCLHLVVSLFNCFLMNLVGLNYIFLSHVIVAIVRTYRREKMSRNVAGVCEVYNVFLVLQVRHAHLLVHFNSLWYSAPSKLSKSDQLVIEGSQHFGYQY